MAAYEVTQEEARRREERRQLMQTAGECKELVSFEQESDIPVTTLEGGVPPHWREDLDATVRAPEDSRRVISTRMSIRAEEAETEGQKRRLAKKVETAQQRQREREQAQEMLRRRLQDVQYCSALCQAYYDTHVVACGSLPAVIMA